MRGSFAFSSGGPLSGCETMVPRHPNSVPQTSQSPFEVTPLALIVGQGQQLFIEIKTTNPTVPFQGFMIQAINNVGIFGQFVAQPNLVNLRACSTPDSTATHANQSPKNSVILEWTVPGNFIGNFQFRLVFLGLKDKDFCYHI